MLIDSHCHLNMLNLEQYESLDAIVNQAKEDGLKYMLCVSVDFPTLPDVLACAERYPHVFASVGVHPNEAEPENLMAEELIAFANHNKVIAIGETGLDYYRDSLAPGIQRQRFEAHIEAAFATDNPLIIHSRNAPKDTIDIMKATNARDIGGVMHCFTETWDVAKQSLDQNFYISISGIVTFKNALQVQEVASKVPLEKLLIETDSPFLAPMPFRGKENYPFYVKYVAEKIAELRGISYEEVVEVTGNNFFNLFQKANNYKNA